MTPEVMKIVFKFLFESIHTKPRGGFYFPCFWFDKENFEQEII